jgi:hypothetical protein
MAIDFAPQSSGTLSGTLTVTDNSATATEVIQLSGTGVSSPTPSDPGFPPDGTLGFGAVASMPMPGYLQTVTDPTFGTSSPVSRTSLPSARPAGTSRTSTRSFRSGTPTEASSC